MSKRTIFTKAIDKQIIRLYESGVPHKRACKTLEMSNTVYSARVRALRKLGRIETNRKAVERDDKLADDFKVVSPSLYELNERLGWNHSTGKFA